MFRRCGSKNSMLLSSKLGQILQNHKIDVHFFFYTIFFLPCNLNSLYQFYFGFLLYHSVNIFKFVAKLTTKVKFATCIKTLKLQQLLVFPSHQKRYACVYLTCLTPISLKCNIISQIYNVTFVDTGFYPLLCKIICTVPWRFWSLVGLWIDQFSSVFIQYIQAI